MATDTDILRAYFKGVKKLFTNFNEATLTSYIPQIQEILCDESGQIDINKFSPDDSYNDLLRAYCTIIALKQSNAMYNDMVKRTQEMEFKPTPAPVVFKAKSQVKIPDGWRVINGGKSKQN